MAARQAIGDAVAVVGWNKEMPTWPGPGNFVSVGTNAKEEPPAISEGKGKSSNDPGASRKSPPVLPHLWAGSYEERLNGGNR